MFFLVLSLEVLFDIVLAGYFLSSPVQLVITGISLDFLQSSKPLTWGWGGGEERGKEKSCS